MRGFFLNGILIWCDYVRVGQFKYSRHLGNIPVYFILFYFSTQNTENRNIAKSVLYIIVQTKKEKKKKFNYSFYLLLVNVNTLTSVIQISI